jgi:general L-amino acid transport system permease protein
MNEYQTLRYVILPQAWKVIVPPLTSQFLSLTKNSSLGVAVGYPELVAVGGTILNQTGRSVEVIIIWMSVYLTISLAISLLMSRRKSKPDARVQLPQVARTA